MLCTMLSNMHTLSHEILKQLSEGGPISLSIFQITQGRFPQLKVHRSWQRPLKVPPEVNLNHPHFRNPQISDKAKAIPENGWSYSLLFFSPNPTSQGFPLCSYLLRQHRERNPAGLHLTHNLHPTQPVVPSIRGSDSLALPPANAQPHQPYRRHEVSIGYCILRKDLSESSPNLESPTKIV